VPNPSRSDLQTVTLLDVINAFKFDCAMGGGRADDKVSEAAMVDQKKQGYF
jgi:sulfate adenylyltransferase subunit 2